MFHNFFRKPIFVLFSLILTLWSCTKFDTTNIGSDLIPVVDNVNTFADTLFVQATQQDYTDTTLIFNSDNHVLGDISNNLLFGKTTGELYFQVKPPFFPYAFGPKDSLTGPGVGLDSVVLCLSYKGLYGDSNLVQQLLVHEIADLQFKDSTYHTNYRPSISNQIGTKAVDIRKLDDYFFYSHLKDSVTNQIRIKLSQAYAERLFNSDSTISGIGNHAFHNDSIYRKEFNGLSVMPVSGTGNGLMYINLIDTFTKLEVHFRIKNGGRIDTTYKSFKVKQFATANSVSITRASATANYVKRDRNASPSNAPTTEEIYLQTQPGTFAALKIPQLTGYSNRIIHRAELIIEQIPQNPYYDSLFPVPNYLYLDLKDTGTTVKYKPVYFDLNPRASYDPDNITTYFYPLQQGPDYAYYGGYARSKTNPLGGTNIYYNINITRYVQRMVIDQSTNYDLRLFPAYSIHYGQYNAYIPYANYFAFGGVKVGSGTNPNYRMRVRIVYSNIKP